MKDILIHMISDDDLMNDLGAATKLVPSPYVMGKLKAAGRRAADAFLSAHADKLGREGTVNLPEMFG
jgi:NTE family protein